MVGSVMMRSESHHHQIVRMVEDRLTSGGGVSLSLSHRLLMVTSDNLGTNADHLWLLSAWLRSLLGSISSEDHLVILPDFTSEELGRAMQVLQFSQQDSRVFNRGTRDILQILGVETDKYELGEGGDGSESQPEVEMEKINNKEASQMGIERKMDPTDSVSDDSDNTIGEGSKNVTNYNEIEKNDDIDNVEDVKYQDIQNHLLMANQNLSDSESDDEEETVDKDEMYLGVHNFLLQDQDLNDTDSDEENIQTEKEDVQMTSQNEEEDCDGNIDEEIKNLSEKSAEGYICKVCGKTGRTRFHLHRDIESHLAGFSHPCNQCKAVMPTRNARVQHIRVKQRNRNKY